ncbi:MAG: sulfotransferase family 2 domain-containing protein [Alphaproteobacteria bacterium]
MAKQYRAPKLVFPHIMKTGGTSLIHWLQQHYDIEDVLHRASTWSQYFDVPQKVRDEKRFIRGHFGSLICRYHTKEAGFFRLVLLRDPVERVVSHYWHRRKARGQRAIAPPSADQSIGEFLENENERIIWSNYQTANLGFDLTADTKMESLERALIMNASSNECFRQACAFIESADFVGTTDRLDLLMASLSERLDLFPQALHRARSYRPRDFRLEPALRRRIERFNLADTELYRFALEKSGRRTTKSVSASGSRSQNSRKAISPPIDLTDHVLVEWQSTNAFFGRGWSDIQGLRAVEAQPHRWSIPGAKSSIQLRLRPFHKYELRLSIFRFVAPEQARGFKVYANGRRLRCRAERPYGPIARGGIYRIVFRAGWKADVNLEFRVSKPMPLTKADHNKGATRGFALIGLTFKDRTAPKFQLFGRAPNEKGRRLVRDSIHVK